MRSKIKSVTKSKEFKPFTVELTMETIEEARLLYYIFTRCNLRDLISADLDDSVAEDFKDDDDLFEQIRNEIEAQGFEV